MTRHTPPAVPTLTRALCVHAAAFSISAALLAACSAPAPAWRAVESANGEPVSLEAMADALAGLDVVFLGEQHDNRVGHELELRLTELLLERRGKLAISLEMFERDGQLALDRYLEGDLDERAFLHEARPWRNYWRDYRPALQLARREGLPVIAGNVPRPLAARVAREGLDAVYPAVYMPFDVRPDPGPYRERFEQAMGGHGGSGRMDNWYAAQVVKDEAMAEAIAAQLEREPGMLVVHWTGYFHSDYHQGTVERLVRRLPGVQVGVVTMRSGSRDPERLDPRVRAAADYVWLVRP